MYKEIFGFCVRRSGHSAMMNWIAGQCEPAIWFSDISMKEKQYSLPCIIRINHGQPFEISKFPRKWLTQGMDGFGYKIATDWKMRIFTFEDNIYNPFTPTWVIETVSNLRTTEHPIIIFTLRDSQDVQNSQNAFGIRYEERDRSTEILKQQREWRKENLFPYQTIYIEYEDWCESEAYRRFISSCLELEFSDCRRKEILSNSSYAKGDKGESILINRWK